MSFLDFLRSERVVIGLKAGSWPPLSTWPSVTLWGAEAMTVNRRWLAREWLLLLAGLVCGFFINFIPYVRGFPWWIPYVLFQMTRATVWAIRTLRESPK